MSSELPDHMPEIVSVMTPFPYFVDVAEPASEAVRMMREHGIRHLPVKRSGELAGVLSDRELRRPAAPPGGDGEPTVGDICVTEAFVVEIHAALDRVLLEMADRHLDSALVVKQGKLAGIFTSTDACRAFGRFLGELYPRDGGRAA